MARVMKVAAKADTVRDWMDDALQIAPVSAFQRIVVENSPNQAFRTRKLPPNVLVIGLLLYVWYRLRSIQDAMSKASMKFHPYGRGGAVSSGSAVGGRQRVGR